MQKSHTHVWGITDLGPTWLRVRCASCRLALELTGFTVRNLATPTPKPAQPENTPQGAPTQPQHAAGANPPA